LLKPQDGIPNNSSIPKVGKKLFSAPRIETRQWGLTRPAIKVSRVSFQGGKAYGCDAKHSLPSGVGVRTAWSYTPTPYIASLKTQGQIHRVNTKTLLDFR
jgi:hypothetical protein